MPISHAVGLLLEAYPSRLISLDAIVAQLDEPYAEGTDAGR
ncbi:hypothetical protein [Streptomyces sp. NPDC047974]